MRKAEVFPPYVRQLKKWQVALLGLLQPPPRVLRVLFPPGLPYSALGRAVVAASLAGLHRSTVRRLVARGYLVRNERGYRITNIGRRYSRGLISWYVDRRPSRWDGRWRLVIFDVPEARKLDRNRLRRLLRQYGFKKLQASVWASPYAVPQEFNRSLWDMRLKPYVLYLLVASVDYDRLLRERFPELAKP